MTILKNEKQFSNSNFAENVMINRGVNVIVTSDRDKALEWLGISSSD